MELTLLQIRKYTREWIDDPYADHFDDPRLDMYINAAYDQVSTIVAESPFPWYIDLESESFSFSPVANVRETKIDTERVRRVFEVTDERNSALFDPVTIVPFAERNERESGVYTFRHTDGYHYLGLVAMPSIFSTLHVRTVKEPGLLSGDSSVPLAVPSTYHMLITYRAALLAKGVQNRDLLGIAALYAEGIEAMLESLDMNVEQFTAQRMSR